MVDQKPLDSKSEHDFSIELEKLKYRKVRAKSALFILLSAVLLFVIAGISLALGSANMTFFDAYTAVLARFFPDTFHVTPLADTVVWTLRLPRIILAILAGAILALGGCTTMATLKNPIATPYTLGVSAGAGFGAAIAIILNTGLIAGPFMIIGNAFVFSLIPVAVILLLIKRKGASPVTMILGGVAMAYFFTACTTILQYFAADDAVKGTVFWAVGDLSNAAWNILPYILGVFFIAFAVNLWISWDLNAMRMGDDTAKSLGVNVDRTRKIALIIACLSTATVIAFTGAIGFICLVAPHICKAVVGQDQRLLVISSGLVGAILLLVADIVARRLIDGNILPVGAITAFLGAPLLFYLLLKMQKSN